MKTIIVFFFKPFNGFVIKTSKNISAYLRKTNLSLIKYNKFRFLSACIYIYKFLITSRVLNTEILNFYIIAYFRFRTVSLSKTKHF